MSLIKNIPVVGLWTDPDLTWKRKLFQTITVGGVGVLFTIGAIELTLPQIANGIATAIDMGLHGAATVSDYLKVGSEQLRVMDPKTVNAIATTTALFAVFAAGSLAAKAGNLGRRAAMAIVAGAVFLTAGGFYHEKLHALGQLAGNSELMNAYMPEVAKNMQKAFSTKWTILGAITTGSIAGWATAEIFEFVDAVKKTTSNGVRRLNTALKLAPYAGAVAGTAGVYQYVNGKDPSLAFKLAGAGLVAGVARWTISRTADGASGLAGNALRKVVDVLRLRRKPVDVKPS